MVSIKSYNIFQRVPGKLIDMRENPSDRHKRILHLKDHSSKPTFLWALESKEAQQFYDWIAVFIIIHGPIYIFLVDNSTKFKGVLLYLLRRHGAKIVDGNTHHLQSQGLVKQGNELLKERVFWIDK